MKISDQLVFLEVLITNRDLMLFTQYARIAGQFYAVFYPSLSAFPGPSGVPLCGVAWGEIIEKAHRLHALREQTPRQLLADPAYDRLHRLILEGLAAAQSERDAFNGVLNPLEGDVKTCATSLHAATSRMVWPEAWAPLRPRVRWALDLLRLYRRLCYSVMSWFYDLHAVVGLLRAAWVNYLRLPTTHRTELITSTATDPARLHRMHYHSTLGYGYELCKEFIEHPGLALEWVRRLEFVNKGRETKSVFGWERVPFPFPATGKHLRRYLSGHRLHDEWLHKRVTLSYGTRERADALSLLCHRYAPHLDLSFVSFTAQRDTDPDGTCLDPQVGADCPAWSYLVRTQGLGLFTSLLLNSREKGDDNDRDDDAGGPPRQ